MELEGRYGFAGRREAAERDRASTIARPGTIRGRSGLVPASPAACAGRSQLGRRRVPGWPSLKGSCGLGGGGGRAWVGGTNTSWVFKLDSVFQAWEEAFQEGPGGFVGASRSGCTRSPVRDHLAVVFVRGVERGLSSDALAGGLAAVEEVSNPNWTAWRRGVISLVTVALSRRRVSPTATGRAVFLLQSCERGTSDPGDDGAWDVAYGQDANRVVLQAPDESGSVPQNQGVLQVARTQAGRRRVGLLHLMDRRLGCERDGCARKQRVGRVGGGRALLGTLPP